MRFWDMNLEEGIMTEASVRDVHRRGYIERRQVRRSCR